MIYDGNVTEPYVPLERLFDLLQSRGQKVAWRQRFEETKGQRLL